MAPVDELTMRINKIGRAEPLKQLAMQFVLLLASDWYHAFDARSHTSVILMALDSGTTTPPVIDYLESWPQHAVDRYLSQFLLENRPALWNRSLRENGPVVEQILLHLSGNHTQTQYGTDSQSSQNQTIHSRKPKRWVCLSDAFVRWCWSRDCRWRSSTP